MRSPSKKAVGLALALGMIAALVITLPAYAATPAITSLSANNVPPGTAITITGTGFTLPNVTSVKFGTTATTFTVVSDTSITTVVPCVGVGAANVVVNNGADSNAQSFTATAPTAAPTITSFTPTAGTAGSTSVAITGANFCGATAVTFNVTAAITKTVNSPTSITATVPVGATTGQIHVTTPVSTGVSAASFTVGPPVISSFSPTTALPGAAVTITGSNFLNASAVNFNGVSATFTVVSATSISTTVPATATTGKITVTNAVGTATSASTFTVGSPSHARSVDFSFSGNRAKGNISVGDGFNACRAFVPVYIQQQKNGRWVLLDTTATNSGGHYSTWVPNKVGKFRAFVRKLTLVNGTVCQSDASPARHHA